MSPSVVVTSYGRPASQALADAVRTAKSGRPLGRVTVVVPSNFAGLTARRMLGGGQLGLNGVANVDFFTPFRFAELVAVGQLHGRRPLTNPVLGAAVRRALAEDPRHFFDVRDHQATEQALAAAVGELANVGQRGLDAIEAAGGQAAAIVGLYRDIRSHLSGYHDEADVARAAAHRPDLAEAAAAYGQVIWYLPGALSAPLAGFLKAMFSVAPTVVIAARSGDSVADAEVARSMRIAGLDPTALAAAPNDIAEPRAGHVISVTDADEEVRAVIREVLQLVDQGVALDRIGIFHPVPDPYVRILEQQCEAAGLAANGPSRRRLAESIAGRIMLAALALPGERWRRDRVIALVNSGPVRFGDGPARPAAWDRISRDAGVVGGLGDWTAKLDRHDRMLGEWQSENREQGREQRVEQLERERNDLGQLGRFLVDLRTGVDAIRDAATWSGRSEAATVLLRQLLGPSHTHHRWPEAEQAAFDAVEASLERLALLDDIDPNPSLSVFTRALVAELSVARGRCGRFGHGLVYGPLASAPGHDLDAVFVLGCTEGLCPAPRREDVLLPDAARALTDGDLPIRLGQLDEQHRLFLAALASAPPEHRWLFFPRGDLRSNHRSRPSRWLLPSASELAGETLFATSFEHRSPKGVHEVASHAQALIDASHYVSVEERDVGQVYAYALDGGEPAAHPAAQQVARGLSLQSARAGKTFTEFDGNVAAVRPTDENNRPLSASRLETWAKCGFRYFLSYELDLADRDDPGRMIELSALDRGSAMHEILERFMVEQVAAGAPEPTEPWGDFRRQRAQEIAAEVFDEYERRGRTGRHINWATQKADLLAHVDEFLTADDHHRASTGATPTYFELAFGMSGGRSGERLAVAPASVNVGQRRLEFRGFIDRVDLAAEGAAFVSDYKTGKGSQYDKLDAGDPTDAGRLLQLGIYAEAVLQHLDVDQVETKYWMVNPGAAYKRKGYAWTPDRQARLREVVALIADGIDAGVHAQAPGDWQSFRNSYAECTYCEFDPICPTARAEHAADKAGAPELEVRVTLGAWADPDADDGSSS